MSKDGDEPLAVFQFYDDGNDVDAYASLQAAEADIEGYDVRNGEGEFFATDGRAVEATIVGEWGQDVSLRVTDHHRNDELRARLAAALPTVGVDASLARLAVGSGAGAHRCQLERTLASVASLDGPPAARVQTHRPPTVGAERSRTAPARTSMQSHIGKVAPSRHDRMLLSCVKRVGPSVRAW